MNRQVSTDVLTSGDLRGRVRANIPMAKLTVWGVGGPAARVFEPADAQDFAACLAMLPASEPVLVIGLGSNLLVRDRGFSGTVVVTTHGLTRLARTGPTTVWAEAGVTCAKLARFAANGSLEGAEFLVGIPGSLGGALAMNAGAFGGEIWPLMVEVEAIDRKGRIHKRAAAEYGFGYREMIPPQDEEEWFVAGELALVPGEEKGSRAEMRALLRVRGESQPTGQRSCGSVFKNPPGEFAGRLIESAGLKGARIGGAFISTCHANFIINDGTASAADIEELIGLVAERVETKMGVRLMPEVCIVGDKNK